MALPKYDKAQRRKTFEQLPKGAYVIKIKNAKEDKWPSGEPVLKIAFDIAEGEYTDFYQKQFDADTREDRKWPFDAVYNLNVPGDKSPQYVWDNWNTFFADLEDSNGGFVFDGSVKKLTNKVIGGKFANKQNENNGTVYDHIVLRWSCVADDVRNGKPGKMPNDKLVKPSAFRQAPSAAPDDFINVPDGSEDEIPF